jgi:hypothetical protein
VRRANLRSCPEHYRSYNFVALPIDEYVKAVKEACQFAMGQYGKVHMIVLDGSADFQIDPNDSEESIETVKFITGLATDYNTVVIVVVHTNYQSPKERGHHGSQMRRKCASVLNITNEDDISTIQPALLRHAGKSDVPLIQFRYDKEKGYHVYCGEKSKVGINKAEKGQARILEIRKIADAVFIPPMSLAYGAALDKIMKISNKAVTSAKSMFSEMKAHEMIVQGSDGNWRAAV